MKTPTFPTYHGPPLPEVLNPLNPRHYLILLGWVYFQPSRLKHYLHRADPDLYRETGRAIFRTVRLPAYRNLYLMSLVLVVVLASGLAWTASAVQGTPVDWTGVAVGVAVGVAFGVAVGVAGGVAVGVAGGVAFGVAGGVGASRLLFHCFEWPLVRLRRRPEPDPFSQLARHPALWDELAVWPLPGLDRLLQTCLEKELLHGGGGAAQVAANPFQSWAAQRALSDYLIAQDNPLTFLYHLAHWPPLDEYFLPPAERYQFRDWPSARLLLLGEVGQTFVEGTERLAWRLTHRLRRMEPTPISQFSAMLYELLRDEDELESQEVAEIKLADRFAGAYEGVRHLPNGEEVAESFASIDRLLQTETIPDLAEAYKALAWLDSLAEPYLRPPVVESLKALSDMSLDIADFFSPATAMSQQAAALNRTAGALNQLAGYIEKEVKPPEQVLLARVVRHWQAIVAQKQGELGEAALQEMSPRDRDSTMVIRRKSAVWQRPLVHFDNPYIAGDPVYPPLFVGRKDVFDRINTVWSAKSNPDSIILFGHRRMGKSSILRNLKQVAREGSLIVYADMAGETSFVESTADLLLGLADKMHAAMRRAYPQASLPEPDSAAYDTPARAQREFNRLTGQIRDVLDGQSLILALDEFEAVERAVKAEKIGKEIFQFLRTKTQEPWLTLVFGGLHTLDEMSRDYHQPFYGSYENIRVSYLSREAAWRLITNPTTDFALNYELEAVERIIAATGGQPYLVQQVCRDALDHLNHELIDLNKEREVRISQADVEAALGNEFFRRGTVYFDGVWTQASQPQQQALLRAVAQRDEPWSADELEATTRLDPEGLRRQLRWAERHDILRKIDGDSPQWEFYVPLMRQWIKNRR